MTCQLGPCLSCRHDQTVTTQCGCVFHLDCLQRNWSAPCQVCLPCPCCSTDLGRVHQDRNGQLFIGIDAGDQWIAYYTIVDHKIEPTQQQFSLWKRDGVRLTKHESIHIRKHIVVT